MLAREYSMSFAAVQKHVAMLERARLVVKRRHGRERLVRSDPERLRQAGELLDRFELIWRERSERISALIGEEETDE